MDRSDTPISDPPSTGAAMARALVSAGVFGALGAWFGSWLGRHGSAPENGLAKPVMKWSMGAFWALVAAYSSLKSSEQERKANGAYAAAEHYQPSRVETLAKAPSGPQRTVDAASVGLDGKTAEINSVSRV